MENLLTEYFINIDWNEELTCSTEYVDPANNQPFVHVDYYIYGISLNIFLVWNNEFIRCHALLNYLTLSHIVTPLQQTIFENIATRVEIAHNEQYLILPQCFQIFSII